MKCYKCGQELDENGVCGHCADESKVRVLSREEKNFYDGITIEEQPDEAGDDRLRFYKKNSFGNSGIYFHQLNLGFRRKNWLNWLIAGAVLTAILGIVLFVALPIVLVLAAVAAVIWLFLSFFQGL